MGADLRRVVVFLLLSSSSSYYRLLLLIEGSRQVWIGLGVLGLYSPGRGEASIHWAMDLGCRCFQDLSSVAFERGKCSKRATPAPKPRRFDRRPKKPRPA
jgi:hypothetical protein